VVASGTDEAGSSVSDSDTATVIVITSPESSTPSETESPAPMTCINVYLCDGYQKAGEAAESLGISTLESEALWKNAHWCVSPYAGRLFEHSR